MEEDRSKIVGSSDAPSIMKVGFDTPLQLWQKKKGLRENITNAAMERGKVMEPEALICFQNITGSIIDPQVKITDPSRPWMQSTLDGLSIDREFLLEIKCPGEKTHQIAKSGTLPERYFPQLQHQLHCAQLEWGYYFSYRNPFDYWIMKVYRDDAYIQTLLVEEEKFYEYLISDEPPPLEEEDYVLRNDEEWRAIADEYLKVSKDLKELEERQKRNRDLLIALSNNSNSKGAGITVSKYIRKGSINYSKVPMISNIDLEQFRGNTVESWRISQ